LGTDEEVGEESQPGDLIPQKHGGSIVRGWTSDQAREAQKKSMASRAEASGKAKDLVREVLGVEWEDADPVIRGLAENAVKGSSADWRLLLQQVGRLKGTENKYDGKGPCPTCGQTPGQGLTITADTIEHLHHARQLLQELIEEDANNLLVSSVGTYRARGGHSKDPRPTNGPPTGPPG